MATSLSIKGKTQANDAVTSTINYVNPNATNAQLQSLASAMNDLTTNTITDVTRIDKNSLTNTVEKLPRNLQLSSATLDATTISENVSDPTEVTLTGAGLSATDVSLTKTNNVTYMYVDWSDDGNGGITISIVGDMVAQTASASEFTFTLPETDTYQAASITLQLQKS